MSHTPHDLFDEFPELADAMRDLKEKDAHFARLFDEYNDVNRAVYRAETDVEPISDEHMTDRRKRRMALKDEIYGYVKQTIASA